MRWLSKENVTFLIAVLGFLMSALSWLKEFLHKRNRIDLTVIDYADYAKGIVQFYLQFQNRSSLPASIARIEIELSGERCTCELEPKLIKKTPAVSIETPHFPIALPPMAFYACYLEFLNVPDARLAPGKTVPFRVHTSRGILKRSLTLSDTDHYLHKRS